MFVAKFLQTKKKSVAGVQNEKKSVAGVQNEKKSVAGVQESKIVQRATQDSVKKNWLNFGGTDLANIGQLLYTKNWKPTHVSAC